MLRFRWWQIATVVAVSNGFVVALFAVAEIGRSRLVDAAADVRRTQLEWKWIVDLQALLLHAESAHRGFLLTGDIRYLDSIREAGADMDVIAARLATMHAGSNAEVAVAIRQLQPIVDERLDQMQEAAAIYRDQGQAAALAFASSPSKQESMARFRRLSNLTRGYEEARLEHSLENWSRELLVVRRLNLAGLIGGLLLGALAGTAMIRSLIQREQAAVELHRQRDDLEARAETQAAELIELYRHLQHVQEEERARLSRGLHDELGGVLLAARMDVTWLQRCTQLDPEETAQRLERVRKALDEGIDLKRRVVEELRPTLLDTMGLVAALRWQVEESCERGGIRHAQHFPDEDLQFTRAGAITLFRVAQEALTNVLKHARATRVDISLETIGEQIVLTVQDDGVGASRDELMRPRSHGIAGMRHRVSVLGGRLDITSRPGGGTCVRVQVRRDNVLQSTSADTGGPAVLAANSGAEPRQNPA